MAHFEIKNLSFSYPMAGGRKALDNINLTIERGQYVTFLRAERLWKDDASAAAEKCAHPTRKANRGDSL